METPQIKVGIMAEKEIFFTLEGNYHSEHSNDKITGKCKAKKAGTGIELISDANGMFFPKGIKLIPFDPETAKFILHDVTIGINFHWERKEDQTFKGGLHFICDDDTSNQLIKHRRLFSKCDLIRNECHLFDGVIEGTCRDLQKLAVSAGSKESKSASC